jgi:hypothetical protein
LSTEGVYNRDMGRGNSREGGGAPARRTAGCGPTVVVERVLLAQPFVYFRSDLSICLRSQDALAEDQLRQEQEFERLLHEQVAVEEEEGRNAHLATCPAGIT